MPISTAALARRLRRRRTGFFDLWETENKSNAWKKLLGQSQLNQNIITNVLPTLRSIKEAVNKTVEQRLQPPVRKPVLRTPLPVPGSPEFEPEGRLPAVTKPSPRGRPMPMLPSPGAPQYEPEGRVLPQEVAPYFRKMIPRVKRWEKDIFEVPGAPELEPEERVSTPEEVKAQMDWKEEYKNRYQDNLDIRLSTLEERNERKKALGDKPTITEESEELAARQHAMSVMLSKGTGTKALLTVLAAPQQAVKKYVTEPLVPDFEFHVPQLPLDPLVWLGITEPFDAKEIMRDKLDRNLTKTEERKIEEEAKGFKVTNELIEEISSWILDPYNLLPVVGWGPDLVRGARLAAKGTPGLLKGLLRNKAIRANLKEFVLKGEAGGRVPGIGPEDIISTDTSISARVTRELDEFGRPRLTGDETAFDDISQETENILNLTDEGKTINRNDILEAVERERILSLRGPEDLSDGELIAALRDKEKRVAGAIEESAEDIAQRIENKVPPSSYKETIIDMRAADPSGIPPRKPPPETKAISPDDPEFDDIQRLALDGEEVPETLMRRHDGAVNTQIAMSRNETTATNELLRQTGLGTTFHGSTVAKFEGSFDELNRLLHNPSKVASGELLVPEELREIYMRLRAGTNWEQAARIDFDPNMATIDDYFYRGWRPPEDMFTSEIRGALGRKPDFVISRIDATYDEMIEAGFRPLFENPAEQLNYSQKMGIKFREQTKLLKELKARELARPDLGGAMPEGWRVPEVGPAFEGKPFTTPEGQAMFTQRYAVDNSLANRLENVYGVVSKHWGKGKAFGKNIDVQKAIDTAVFIPKRAKLIGSVFQHVDFLSRSGIGAWTGFIDALRHGHPIESVYHLLKWPQTAFDIATVAFRPGFKTRLRRLAVDNTPLFRNRKLSNKMISEAGVSTYDPTILPELDKVISQVREEGRLLKWGKAPFRLLNDLERFWRDGLFNGVYPAAIWADIKNNIAPAILRQHPKATDEQLAGMIAKAANTSYSSIPAATSVVQNKQARWFLTRFLFSLGENEGLLRTFTGAIKGENAAYFRTRLLGLYLGMMTTANTIHFASTGKPLPYDRWTPISTDNWGPLPIGYNRDFAAPTIPLTGRSGTELTLDLMGQMDTAFRILDPIGFLTARVNVPARTIYNQARGKDFFGAPIDTVGPGGVFSRASQLAQDLFAPIGFGQAGLEALRQNINKTEGLIQPGESRLGDVGLGIQAMGVNIRGEPTKDLLNRIRADVMQDMKIDTVKIDTAYAKFTGIEDVSILEKIKQGDVVGVFEGDPSTYEKLDTLQKSEVDAEVEKRIGPELEMRQEISKLRGQIPVESQFYDEMDIMRIEQGEAQLAADDKFNSGQWDGNVWRKDFADRQQEYYIRRDEHKEALGIEFKDYPAKSIIDEAINNYFDVNLDDDKYKQEDGTYDWEAFFGDQEDTLNPLSPSDKRKVMEFIHKYDTPTVKKFRKTREDLNEFYDMSQFYGLSAETSEAIKELTNPDGLVLRVTRAEQISIGEEMPSDYFDILMTLSSELHNKKDFKGAENAFYAAYSTRESEARDLMNIYLEQGNTKEAAIMAGLIEGNPERDRFIMKNLELLKFFPDLKKQLSEKERAYLSAGKSPAISKFGFTGEYVSGLPEIFQRGQYNRSPEEEIIARAQIKGTDYGVPKYKFLSIEQGHQVDELLEKVKILTREARDAGQEDVPTHREYLWGILSALERNNPLYDVVAVAYLLKTDAKDSIYTPEALVDKQRVVELYLEEEEDERKETEGLLP